MDFTVFDTKKIDEYSKRAKEQWGETSEYREYEEKSKNMTDVQQKDVINRFMLIFAEFGKMYASGGEFTENIDSYGGKGTR